MGAGVLNSTQREECSTSRTTTLPTVIVVDDEPDFRAILQTRLGAEGWRVLQAGDVAGLYELLEENEPDVLVLDHSLPGITGIDAAKVLLRNHFSRPVVIFSAYLTPELKQIVPRARPACGRQDQHGGARRHLLRAARARPAFAPPLTERACGQIVPVRGTGSERGLAQTPAASRALGPTAVPGTRAQL